jgi:uncharacterized membrane protein
VREKHPPRWRAAARLLAVAVFVAYPVLVWEGLTRGSPRQLALLLLCVLVPLAALRVRGPQRAAVRDLAVVPLVTAAALGLAALLDAAGWMLAVPVAINAALLVVFAASLRRGSVPMVERFARLQVPHLTAAQQAWCRTWTRIWCGFFVANSATALALALLAPLSWWALYNGLVAYVLMGALLAGEWLLRRRRFAAPPA